MGGGGWRETFPESLLLLFRRRQTLKAVPVGPKLLSPVTKTLKRSSGFPLKRAAEKKAFWPNYFCAYYTIYIRKCWIGKNMPGAHDFPLLLLLFNKYLRRLIAFPLLPAEGKWRGLLFPPFVVGLKEEKIYSPWKKRPTHPPSVCEIKRGEEGLPFFLPPLSARCWAIIYHADAISLFLSNEKREDGKSSEIMGIGRELEIWRGKRRCV